MPSPLHSTGNAFIQYSCFNTFARIMVRGDTYQGNCLSHGGTLSNYDYRITLTWPVFAMAGAAALLITIITVSFLTVRAALANPVKSLKTE